MSNENGTTTGRDRNTGGVHGREVYLTYKQTCGTLGLGVTMVDRLVSRGYLTVDTNKAATTRGVRYRFKQKEVLDLKAKIDAGTFNPRPLRKALTGRPKGTFGMSKVWQTLSDITTKLDRIETKLNGGVTTTAPQQ